MLTWSHSRLKTFELCPAQYEGKYIQRIKEEEGEAARWGTRVHEDLEKAIKDNTPLPEATKPFAWVLELGKSAAALGATVHTEYKMGLTEQLQPCGMMDRNVWLRGIADLVLLGSSIASVWDYKTGKQRNDNTQLQIMAGMVFAHNDVERVEARYLWLQEKKQSGVSYNKSELPKLWENLLFRVRRMERAHETGTFQPQPSWACKYCPVTACMFNRTDKK